MVSVLYIAWFSDVRGRSRSLSKRRPRSFANRKGPRTTSDVWESGYSERGREGKGTANDLGRLRIRLFWEREGRERDRERPRTSENQAILREGGKGKGPRTTSDVWESGYSERGREAKGTVNDLGRLRIRLFFTKNYNYKLRKLKFKTLKVMQPRIKNKSGLLVGELTILSCHPRSVHTKFYSRDWLYNLLFTSEQ